MSTRSERRAEERKRVKDADHGFEFSIPDIKAFLDGVRASKIYDRDLANPQRVAHAA